MAFRTQLYTRLALTLLLTGGGIGAAVAHQPPDVVKSDVHENTAMGTNALLNTKSSSAGNTASGFDALLSNTSGIYNTASGDIALQANTTGSFNTASGYEALWRNTTGNGNTASGFDALQNNTTGGENTASGQYALFTNTTGSGNTASGLFALDSNTTGTQNTANGGFALDFNGTGSNNTASGYEALARNQTGSNNIGVGYQAGFNAAGSNNIEIGNSGRSPDNNVIRIGTQGTQNFTVIAGISGVNVTGGAPVVVNSKGQLGVVSSSRRYKQDIRSMGTVSDRLLALRPVTFRYKKADENGQKPEQYGLIAEEVAKVMPELVVFNEKGQPETVAYQTLTPLLLNELQREHKQILELKARDTKVDALQAEVVELRRLTTQLAASR